MIDWLLGTSRAQPSETDEADIDLEEDVFFFTLKQGLVKTSS